MGSSPSQPKLVCIVPIFQPDRVCIFDNEFFVGLFAIGLIKIGEVAHEDTLELGTIGTAPSRGLTWLHKDTVGVHQSADSGIGNCFSLADIGMVTCNLVHVQQSAQDNALVVGPGGLTIVLAYAGQSIIDQVLGVNHAAFVKPRPLLLSPMQVAFIGCTPIESCSNRQEEFVGNSVFIITFLGPPDAASTCHVPTSLHISKDSLSHA